MPHSATTLSKNSTPFMKNVTTKTRQDGNSFLPVTTPQLTLHKQNSLLPPPTPDLVQNFVSGSSDGRRIPDIIIGIMPDKSFHETSYKFCDTYGRIYSTTTRLLIEPMQDKIQAYHHHIEAEENAAASANTTTDTSDPDVPSEEPLSGYPNSSPSDVPSQDPLILLSQFPSDNPL